VCDQHNDIGGDHVAAKNPRQGFVAGSLAGMLEARTSAGAEQTAEAVRKALMDPIKLDAVRAELADAQVRLSATPPASGVYAENEAEVRVLREVLALK
jgi:hypothetical protein